MKLKFQIATTVAALSLLSAGGASAALLNGYSDASNNTSVFISVVERNNVGQVLRNLVIDTGARTLDVFAGTPWSTTPAQEAQILAFIGSSTGTVLFNVGGGLNDQTFTTDRQGFISSGNAVGPASDGYAQLTSAIASVDTFIGNTKNGVFNSAGVLAANASIDPGWHNFGWGRDVGGSIETSNEVLFGQTSQIIGWKTAPETFEIIRSVLGTLTSNVQTGDVSFSVAAIPLPGVAWFLAPLVAVLAPWLKRRQPGV